MATHSQKKASRASRSLGKFFFCVTTPMLVIVSVIGICQTHELLIGRKCTKM